MRKKDYELIAEVILLKRLDIQDAKRMGYISDDEPRLKALNELTEDLANRFELEYKFDRQKFLTACGIYTINGQIVPARSYRLNKF